MSDRNSLDRKKAFDVTLNTSAVAHLSNLFYTDVWWTLLRRRITVDLCQTNVKFPERK